MHLSDDTIAHLIDVTEAPDLTGTRYRLVSELGRGGMGVVYIAQDAELDREVAVKVLRTELDSASAADRLVREARIIASLEHPGIVPVHDVGVLPDGRIFYVMKLVRGMRLDEFAGADRAPAELFRVFIRICEAVSFAHAHGVIHRDLKPQNVMVGAFGEVLVMDWGVAKLNEAGVAAPGVRFPARDALDRSSSAPPDSGSDPLSDGDTAGLTAPDTQVPTDGTQATRPGTVIGTRGYRAPEQERGDVAAIDARSDVYALGAILRSLTQVSVERPARPISAIIAKAMADHPSARYASADELARDVQQFLDGAPVGAYRESIIERAGRALRRNRTAVTLVVGYLVMRAIVFLWLRR